MTDILNNPTTNADVAVGFLSPDEIATGERFLEQGYLIQPVENQECLHRIRLEIARIATNFLQLPESEDPHAFLDGIADHVSVQDLNDFRLAVIHGINGIEWLRPTYFALVRNALNQLVGNELAMQLRINLSIQLPGDDSSLLPSHGDVWSGDSSFEVVVWLPLVDCENTKCMYLLPPKADRKIQANLHQFQSRNAEDLFETIENDVQFINIRFGEIMIFNQNLIHGNRINRESSTRWSMNCRFKSVFSPYADKKLGEFFEPVTLRPATRIGLSYNLPGGFDE